MAALRAGWMVGVVGEGLAIVGPDVAATVTIAGGPPAAADLAEQALRAEPAEPGPVADLRTLLADLGALGPAAAPERPLPGSSLAEAVAAALAGRPPAGAIWTAEEALVLSPAVPDRGRTRAIRAFVAGLEPQGRLETYALLAQGIGAVHGDVPDGSPPLDTELARGDRDGAEISVVDLTGDGPAWRLRAADLDRLGAEHPHRLGPIRRSGAPAPVVPDLADLHLCVAEVAPANLNFVAAPQDRLVQGVGSAGHARFVAHAEGAERFAAGDLTEAEIVTAARRDLPGALDPGDLYANDRDPPSDGTEPRLWSPVLDRHGNRRWAPAETVHLTVSPATLPWTSSGLAAGRDVHDARRRALRELVERDAFMVAWLRRTRRARVAPATVPAEARRLAGVLRDRGWATTWVDLTLDTLPVLLCCLTHERAGLTLGAGCHPDPAAALLRATTEALVLALRFEPGDGPPPAPHLVRSPRDHLRLHRDPRRRADHAFLFDGPDELDLRAIPHFPEDDLDDALDDLGSTPLTADLSGALTGPYAVVRALAPGLVPLTFGYEREATAMARIREGVMTRDGRWHGDAPHTGPTRTRIPHPFP
ncbi:MAG TPA: YcaO-like family protein [Baekduia sp.]|jgi:thiazole/oxazole-forming peptide maturase SagD family component